MGIYVGAGFGEESAIWYAERYNETGNPIYFVGGLFASLWTPDTWLQTTIAIATIPTAAERITAAGLKSLFSAARAALREIVEEGLGIPVPGKGRFLSRSGGEILEGATWHEVEVASESGGRNLPFKDADRLTEVNNTLDRIESSGPFPYKRDGSIFKNKEGRLPEGNYREYTVITPGKSNRGARRIVRETETGKTYYTDDHYRNFVQIDPTKR